MLESQEHIIFESYGYTVIVDNYPNAQICSEEIIFTDKIDLIISNGVATIGGKDLILKGLAQLSGTQMMMMEYSTQIKLIIYHILQTHQSIF